MSLLQWHSRECLPLCNRKKFRRLFQLDGDAREIARHLLLNFQLAVCGGVLVGEVHHACSERGDGETDRPAKRRERRCQATRRGASGQRCQRRLCEPRAEHAKRGGSHDLHRERDVLDIVCNAIDGGGESERRTTRLVGFADVLDDRRTQRLKRVADGGARAFERGIDVGARFQQAGEDTLRGKRTFGAQLLEFPNRDAKLLRDRLRCYARVLTDRLQFVAGQRARRKTLSELENRGGALALRRPSKGLCHRARDSKNVLLCDTAKRSGFTHLLVM